MSVVVLGKNTVNDTVVSHVTGFIDWNTKKSATPQYGAPGSSHIVDLEFSVTDNGIVDDYYLEFDLNTSDSTNYPNIANPFMLLAEIKYLLNNVEVTYLKSSEDIYNALAENLRSEDPLRKFSIFQKFRQNIAANYTPDAVTTTASYQLPLTLLFGELKKHTTLQGITKPSFQFRFQPNYGTVVLNNRFVQSATSTNCWDTSKISISNINLRPVWNRYGGVVPRSVPNPLFLLHKYDFKDFSQSWNTVGTDKIKVNLTDF